MEKKTPFFVQIDLFTETIGAGSLSSGDNFVSIIQDLVFKNTRVIRYKLIT